LAPYDTNNNCLRTNSYFDSRCLKIYSPAEL